MSEATARETAERCCEAALAALERGDVDKAQRLAEKAMRLAPSDEVRKRQKKQRSISTLLPTSFFSLPSPSRALALALPPAPLLYHPHPHPTHLIQKNEPKKTTQVRKVLRIVRSKQGGTATGAAANGK